MSNNLTVTINFDLLDSIFEGARRLYPKETFLLLRGRKRKEEIRVTDLVVPPLAVYGYGFANLPFHMLPMDFSIVGTIHSHPSGSLVPSVGDLNHSIGKVIVIVAFPYQISENVTAYNRDGKRLSLQVI